MKVGDLVRLNVEAFTGIGYIKEFSPYGDDYILVGFISGNGYSKANQAYFFRSQLTLVKGE